MISGLRVLYTKEELKWHQALLRYLALVIHPGLIVNYFITLAVMRNHPLTPFQMLIILLPYVLLVVRLLSVLKPPPNPLAAPLMTRLAAGGVLLAVIGVAAFVGAVYTNGAIIEEGARNNSLFNGYGDVALFALLWLGGLCLGLGVLLLGLVRWLHMQVLPHTPAPGHPSS